MKRFFKIPVVGLISLISFFGSASAQVGEELETSAKVREEFYKHCFGLYLYYSGINNTSRGYENLFLDEESDLMIKYPPKYSLVSVNFHIDNATDYRWGLHSSVRSNFFGDCWYLFFPSTEEEEPGEINMRDKMSVNFFCSVIQWNQGLNFLVTEKIRVAAGGSFTIYVIDTYNQDGSQYLKNGGHFMIGPYINGDVILNPWLLFRVEAISSFTFYHRGNVADNETIDKIKNPYIISVFPYFITKLGLFAGAEFTFINRMIDTDYSNPSNQDINTGYKFHTTRMDLKLGYIF
jgi:hypothetical protein